MHNGENEEREHLELARGSPPDVELQEHRPPRKGLGNDEILSLSDEGNENDLLQNEDNMVVKPEDPSFLGKLKRFFGSIIPYGGFLSSVFNLASVCVGGGILGLPSAANSSGMIMAMLYLFVIAACAVYSLHILSVSMEKTNLRTFESMAQQLISPRFDYFVAAIRWINSFGATIAYVISVGDILSPILLNSSGTPEYLKTTPGIRLIRGIAWVVVMLPLVLPKNVNSLRYVSTVAVAFVVYFVIMLVIHSSRNGLPRLNPNSPNGIRLFNTGNSAIEGLGVFMFAFVCQVNCFEVYWEMRNRSPERFTLYAVVAMMLCLLLYVMTVFFGYSEFGTGVDKSILLMFNPVAEAMVMVAYIGMFVKLCASYALQTMSCRNAIYHVIRWDLDTLPYWKHFIAVIFLSLVGFLCGLFIPDINTVFGLVGAICGGFLSFVFPALFFLYSGNWTLQSVGWFHYLATHGLLIAGVIGITFGTIASIYGTAKG